MPELGVFRAKKTWSRSIIYARAAAENDPHLSKNQPVTHAPGPVDLGRYQCCRGPLEGDHADEGMSAVNGPMAFMRPFLAPSSGGKQIAWEHPAG